MFYQSVQGRIHSGAEKRIPALMQTQAMHSFLWIFQQDL